jgi:hypothetical protein
MAESDVARRLIGAWRYVGTWINGGKWPLEVPLERIK